ncbi:hypothetical protein [Roseateles cavernae]|uniref:hypothetical protein n=1 Tax=Roseateles cavernae TaxID=3153578 RepID=UPI0032E46DF5
MRTKERSDINTEVLGLKQASMSEALLAARDAATNGMLRSRTRSTNVPFTREFRVKSA